MLYFLLALPGVAIVVIGRGRLPALVLAAVYLLLPAAVGAAVKGIFTAALYRYATTGEIAGGFSVETLRGAVQARAPVRDNWT